MNQLIQTMTAEEKSRLCENERVIAAGLNTFVDVGNALAEIRDGKLYRAEFGTFDDYCRDRWGISKMHAYRLMDAAEVSGVLKSNQLVTPQTESQARPLARLEPDEQIAVWQQAIETAPNGKVTAAHVAQVVGRYRQAIEGPEVAGEAGRYIQGNNGVKQCLQCGELWAADLDYCPYCHISPEARMAHVQQERRNGATPYNNHAISDDPDYDGDEWFTPSEYIEAARGVMGGIDLDPASHEDAQAVVQAGTYYTKESNGLARSWFGRVWLNPPYSMPLIKEFVLTAIDEYEAGRVEAAIILTNNSSDTAWFHALLSMYPACFTRGRIQFWRPGQPSFSARQGQVFFYLGDNPLLFVETFGQFGIVIRRWNDDNK